MLGKQSTTEKPHSQKRKIAIFTGSQKGFGDLIFAYRLAGYIKEQNLGYEIEIFADRSDLLKLNSLGMDGKHYNEFKGDEYSCVIIGPGVCGIGQFNDSVYQQFENKPVMLLSEYDYDDHFNMMRDKLMSHHVTHITEIKAGLSAANNGILIEPKLTSQRNHDELSDGNLKAELAASMQQGSTGSNRTVALAYCSYLPAVHVPIIHANYAAGNASIQHYDLVMISTSDTNFATISTDESFINKLTDILKKGGFTKLVFVDVDHPGVNNKKTYTVNDAGEAKEFKVLYTKKVTHKDMLTLHRLTGSELTTITGDQSFTEAISKGSMFHYLAFGAGHKVYFIDAFVRCAEKYGYSDLIEYLVSDRVNPNIVYKKEMEVRFVEFCEIIRNNHNFGNVVVGQLERLHRASLGLTSNMSSDTTARSSSTQAVLRGLTTSNKVSTPEIDNNKQYVYIILRNEKSQPTGYEQYILSDTGNLKAITESAKRWAQFEGREFDASMVVELHLDKKQYRLQFVEGRGTYKDKAIVDKFIEENTSKKNANTPTDDAYSPASTIPTAERSAEASTSRSRPPSQKKH